MIKQQPDASILINTLHSTAEISIDLEKPISSKTINQLTDLEDREWITVLFDRAVTIYISVHKATDIWQEVETILRQGGLETFHIRTISNDCKVPEIRKDDTQSV